MKVKACGSSGARSRKAGWPGASAGSATAAGRSAVSGGSGLGGWGGRSRRSARAPPAGAFRTSSSAPLASTTQAPSRTTPAPPRESAQVGGAPRAARTRMGPAVTGRLTVSPGASSRGSGSASVSGRGRATRPRTGAAPVRLVDRRYGASPERRTRIRQPVTAAESADGAGSPSATMRRRSMPDGPPEMRSS
ncbi:MAG: hypothetical protein QM767_24035 [Anaeromyxobacter sp.]